MHIEFPLSTCRLGSNVSRGVSLMHIKESFPNPSNPYLEEACSNLLEDLEPLSPIQVLVFLKQEGVQAAIGHIIINKKEIAFSLTPTLEMNQTYNEEWQRLGRWAATCVAMYAAYAAILVSVYHCSNYLERSISNEGDYERHALMERLTLMDNEDFYNQLRMGKDAFARLVNILRGTGRLRNNAHSNVEEQVAKFLHIVDHNLRNRTMKFYFKRSSETISRHFHQVLRAIISLDDVFLKQPDGLKCPQEIKDNTKFWPYFKDCIGAIDGSHFRVKVSNDVVHRYRGRNYYPTQNVLAACSFDLKFTYVLPGWEGSASDSRILDNALVRDFDKLIVPQGKYYLADAGFQLKIGFLTPYRSTRYHLKEYSVHQPENDREVFNLRHSSLRNAIERAFGVLKKRFPIIASGTEPHYPVDTQSDIILACCILHNYLMGVDPDERLIAEVDRELFSEEAEFESMVLSLAEKCKEGEILREKIAMDMWKDYNRNR
ncbi:putative nuclease HARBI1 [Vitis vinifera]|uniref:Putative nuclease HARBI1 n=1 Tax=Vitis vinifera TaxID=29760 RepID=A0A438GU82_VITVI|nr:putative nuclease HARBI1 [Vitis vinifera]